MEYGNQNENFIPEKFFKVDLNNLRNYYIRDNLRNDFSSRFELEERKIELEEEIEAHNEAICLLLNELHPEKIEIIDDFYETFIIIPKNIDSSAYEEDEIVLFGYKSYKSYKIRLSDRELIEINGYELLPFERQSMEVNGYKIFRIGHGI
ncbi:MAG: hypothetical protein H0Z24_07500 [Thermosipho sp. (in: Bacteria)]|nr:hypothetical protein [Thermosipho sp. (in: thermotogales)]